MRFGQWFAPTSSPDLFLSFALLSSAPNCHCKFHPARRAAKIEAMMALRYEGDLEADCGDSVSGSAVWLANAGEESRLHRGRSGDSGAGHRCEHGAVLGDQWGVAQPAAVSATRSVGDVA